MDYITQPKSKGCVFCVKSNSSSEEEITDDLKELSGLMKDQGNSRSGKIRDRYLLLAETLEGIADRLR